MADCLTLIQGTRLRATLVDACGEPVAGACSTIVTDGFISVAMTDNVESPTEFKVKNAAGAYCINQRSLPLLNWIEVKISLCQVMPELFAMLSGSPTITDDSTPTPVKVGFGTDTDTYASASFALELWTNVGRGKGGACASGSAQYGYMLLPWLIEGVLGGVTVENGPVNFELSAVTADGNGWGVGPYNDVIKTRLGALSALRTPIPTTRHRHLQFTSAPPPAVVCGCQTLVIPS